MRILYTNKKNTIFFELVWFLHIPKRITTLILGFILIHSPALNESI